MASIRVEGAQELIAALRQFENKTANQIVRRVMREGAKEINTEAKALAPKRTGLVSRSLRVRAGLRRKGRVTFVSMIGDKDYVGKTFYGAFLNYGHKIGKRGSPIVRKKVEGSEFLNKAYQKKAPTLAKKLPAMMWDEMARTAAGLRTRTK